MVNIMSIMLLNNKGFEWCYKDYVYVKGIFFYKNILYKEHNAIGLLRTISSYDAFRNIIKEFNGIFSIIIKKDDEYWIAVDRARSIPIFLSTDGKYISDSAEEIRIKFGISIDKVEIISLSELFLSHNTSTGNTVYKDIIQLELGQTALIKNGKVERKFYYTHTHSYQNNNDYKILLEQFSYVADSIIDRLITSLEGRKVVLALSGGYDSRFIAAMLKRKNYNNVLCYTYGKEDDYEVNYSKKVAQKLGFEWHYVKYTKQDWEDFFNSKEAYLYFDYVGNHSSLPHIQEFIAIKNLKDRKVIDTNSIIVTGFCGDFQAGSFIKPFENIEYTLDNLVNTIYNFNYVNTVCTNVIEKKIKNRIKEQLLSLNSNIYDKDSFISLYEAWLTANRLSMWVVNSNRVYEFFGLEWRIPLMDNEFLEFWYNIPNFYRKGCKLYKEWLFDNLFIPMGIDYRKPEILIQNTRICLSKLKKYYKKILIFLSMNIGKDLYKRNNLNNYNEAALIIFKMMNKSKRAFKYNYLSVHQIESLWWCEYKYGSENIKKIIRK